MRPAFLGWEEPWLFLLSFAIVLVSWTAGVRLPYGLPGGLAAVVIGTLVSILGACLVSIDTNTILNALAVPEALARLLHWPI